MNRQELIERIAEITAENKSTTERFLDAFIRTVQETVATEEKVTISRFGTFSLKKLKACMRRHPASGKLLQIEESSRPKFTPGSNFRELVLKNQNREKTS